MGEAAKNETRKDNSSPSGASSGLDEIPIRLAGPSDFHDAMALCRDLYDENGIFPPNWDKVGEIVRKATDHKFGIMGLIGDTGRVQGGSLLLISQFWYTDTWHLEELYNYVRPDFRRSTHAKRLIRWTKEQSDKLKIPLVTGIISEERTASKIRLFEREFGPMRGAFFVHSPKGCDGEKLTS